ncbi:S8 family serine peptidase [Klenkia terrae]|uniref:S8 family serine peptidase n=1 Tax=Klenkia terrae TaxID=1052259 RepID=A0ABU8E942_9ACTN|nr:S8 family serine peptidase [Klenkia terrae]
MGSAWGADRRILAAGMAATVVVGFVVAAAVDALAAPEVAVAEGYGPGDGLSRWVLGTADPVALVPAAEATPGVVNAQPLFDGGVLVATTSADPTGLAAIPGVTSVEPSVSAELMADPTDPYWSDYGYNLENTGTNFYNQTGTRDADVDATAGWAATTGTGEVVAVLDSGYDLDHPDMSGALWSNPLEACGSVDTDGNGLAGDCNGWDFTRNAPITDATESGSHGVAVSGVAAARAGNGIGSAGVAPGASIMPLVIGSGSTVDVNLGAQAIRYAVDHGATVINASWGGPTLLPALQSAVAYAGANDVLVVAAAGNDAVDRDATPMYPASLPDPAIVSVGSSTAADTLSAFSAWGATSVDLMAPGTLVFLPWPDGGYRLASGTSFSAPEVAAVIAQYRSLMPTATAQDIKQALLADVDPIPGFVGRSVSGGRLTTNGLAALGTTQVRWTYSSMTGAPGPVRPALTTSSNLPTGDYTAVLGLGMRVDGQVYAVAGQPLTVGGSTVATDDTGTAAFPLGARGPASGALVLSPTTTLLEGRYVLTVQLLLDGDPFGRASAAPLTVATAPTPTPTASPTSAPTTGGPAPTTAAPPTGTSPGGSSPTSGPGATGSPAPSGTAGPSSTPAAPTTPGSGSAPTTAAGPTSTAGPTAAPTAAPSTTRPAVPTATAPTSAGPTSTTTPTTGAGPTSSTPGAGPTSTSPRPTTTAAPTAVGTAPPSGGTVYPGVGDFLVTSVSPDHVDVAGGAQVTVVGTFPSRPTVLVGSTTTATVVSSSATQVVFTAPARVAGSYTLLLSTSDGKRSQLTGALTYVAGTAAPTTAAPTSTSAPATPTVAVPSPTPSGPVIVTGPGGQRLVGTAFFSSIPASVWTVDCSSSCSGTLL